MLFVVEIEAELFELGQLPVAKLHHFEASFETVSNSALQSFLLLQGQSFVALSQRSFVVIVPIDYRHAEFAARYHSCPTNKITLCNSFVTWHNQFAMLHMLDFQAIGFDKYW